MNVAGLVILVVVTAVGAGEEASQPFTITMIAASATKEGPVMAQKTPEYGGLVKSMAPQGNKKKGQKHFDPELKSIEQAVADLPYDTYRKINVLTEKVSMNQEAEFAINSTYTLHATPVEKDDQDRVRMDLRIDEKTVVESEDAGREDAARGDARGEGTSTEGSETEGSSGKKTVVREALKTTSSIAPGKPLRLGGLKLKEGRLVIVLSVEPTP